MDIISSSPNLYLFHKESNKTNFGGFLFIVYMVIILLILIYYLVQYFQNPKYTIQSFSHFNFKTKAQKEERNNDTLYNPNIKFIVNVSNYNSTNKAEGDISNEFLLFDWNKNKTVDFNSEFENNISNFDYLVLFECNDTDCSNYFDYIRKYREDNRNIFYLNFYYQGFTLDHQDGDKPIKKNTTFERYYQLNWESSIGIINYWTNILYSEKKELFQKNYNDSCGYIESYNSISSKKFYTYKKKVNFLLSFVK